MSADQDFEIRRADGDARVHISNLVEMMRAASHPPADWPQERLHDWLGICLAAAATTAGVHYGTLAAVGMVANQRNDRRQALKIVEKNFTTGIDLALRHASGVATRKGAMQ